jgi:beta-glucosidase
MAWYPGQEGGPALADLLLGRAQFAGRLPITFYHSVADLPPFDDYSMERRTHRFFRGTPLFRFGHGLTYVG